MSSLSILLESYRLQTVNLPPDKLVHILRPEQIGGADAASVLYKKKSGSAGRLGGGSFGAVHLEYCDSECAAAPHVRAVKTINKAIAKESKVQWQQEIGNLITLSKFPELFVNIFGWWEDDKSIFLPMEYFEASDLSRYIGYIRDENEIRAISHQIALGLEKMHALRIIHRDLKPQNIFVAAQGPEWKVKIGDFGFSKRISQSVSDPYSTRGTIKYMAPEYRDLWNSQESSNFNSAVDMWSFGCLIYELFVHKCPFEEEGNSFLKRYVKDKVFPRQPLDKQRASSESIWLISKLLEPDPDHRPRAEDALEYTWFAVESEPAQQMDDLTTSVEPLTVNSQHRHPSIDSLKSTPDASVRLHPATESAPPAFVISVAASDENQTGASSPQSLRPTELSERGTKVPTTTLNNATPIPDKSIPKPSSPSPLSPRLPPRPKSSHSLRADVNPEITSPTPLSPRLPPRPKSSNSLRADAHKAHAKPPFVKLPHEDLDTLADEMEVIKPDNIEMPRGSSPMPAKSRRTIMPAPSLRSTKAGKDCIDMDFKGLPLDTRPNPMCDICEARRVFNPVIKPAALYFCKDCDHRPLCARCIMESFHNPADPHEADHKLQAWIQGHVFPFATFLERFPAMTTSESGLEGDYGRSWLSSDCAFVPPIGGQLTTRFTMYAPPGEYTVSVDLRTFKCGEAMRSSTIGHYNAMMVKKAKAIKLGSILVGAQTADRLINPAKENLTYNRYLPEVFKEHAVVLTEEEDRQTVTLGRSVRVEPGRLLEVHIRGSYDSVFFKAGSPFKWWLDEISYEYLVLTSLSPYTRPADTLYNRIAHMGSEEHVASMGARKMRENFKEQQARLQHKQKVQKNMGLMSQSFIIAGKVIPGGKLLSTLASGTVKLSASAMKDPQGKAGGIHSAPQVVHNHYVLMNDTPSQQQWQQQEFEFEEQPECEEPDAQGSYVEQGVYQEQVEYFQEETNSAS